MEWLEQINQIYEVARNGARATQAAADAAVKIKGLLGSPEPSSDHALAWLVATLVNEVADAKLANAELKLKLSDLQQAVLAAQKTEARAQKYTIAKTPAGQIVRRYQREKGDTTPSHDACPKCFERGEIHPLHEEGAVKLCKACDTKFRYRKPEPRKTMTPRWRSYE